MGVLLHDLLLREPARHSARYTTLGLAREQDQTSYMFRVFAANWIELMVPAALANRKNSLSPADSTTASRSSTCLVEVKTTRLRDQRGHNHANRIGGH